MITRQDSILLTLHNKADKKIGKKSFKTVADAIVFGDIAIKQYPEVVSYRILDVIYNSKYKD